MYLSRLRFHTANRDVRHTLQTPYRVHAAIMRGFPGHVNSPTSRVLFRQEQSIRLSLWDEVLVQSPIQADWNDLSKSFGSAFNYQQKPISITVRVGQYLRFRLRANPVVTRAGKRVAILDESEQRDWLVKRGEKLGFTLHDHTVNNEGIWTADKGAKDTEDSQLLRIAICTALYDGCLIVRDADKFTKVLQEGIGSAKGFGCGLLSVAPAR